MLIELLERRVLLSNDESFPLLKDIHTGTQSSSPLMGAALGSEVVFSAWGPDIGYELWITTGAAGGAGGARLIADIDPGPDSSEPRQLVTLGSRVLFWATGPDFATRLWATDGTAAGTVPLSPSLSSGGSPIVVANGLAYTWGTDLSRSGLFRTDGTPAGTAFVTAASIGGLAEAGGVLYYTAGPADAKSLWRLQANGTSTQLTPAAAEVEGPMYAAGSTLLFTASRDTWRTDGTVAGTVRMPNLLGGFQYADVGGAARLDNGRIIFSVGGSGRLFALNTDGTVSAPLTFALNRQVVAVGNRAYFGGRGGLWATDGTAAGTQAVGPNNASQAVPVNLTRLGSRVLFTFHTAEAGLELWASDGTAAGTRLLNDINPGPASSEPLRGYTRYGIRVDGPFLVAGARAFFAATDGGGDVEPWSSDGTAAGTVRAAHVYSKTGDGIPDEPQSGPLVEDGVEFNGKTYFAGDGAQRLWVTDGTAAGTQLVIDSLAGGVPWNVRSLVVHDGWLYFVATYPDGRGNSVSTPFRSDGTAAGTVRITSAAGGPIYLRSLLFPFKGKIAFFGTAGDSFSWGTLWTSDGTPQGTTPFGRQLPSRAEQPTVSGDYLYFRLGEDLCRHDGNDWSVIDPRSYATHLTDLNGKLLYEYDGVDGVTQLRVADAAGVRQVPGPDSVHGIARLGGHAYVAGWSFQDRESLWKTDGTPAGTTRVFGGPGAWQGVATALRAAGGRLWFFGHTNETGLEPWVSDGTAAGTRRVADLNPGTAGSFNSGYPGPQHDPHFAAWSDGYVYFQATTAAAGTELFRSDGTPAGTSLVADFIPGPGDSIPGPVMRAGGRLFFAAEDPQYGREWRLVAGPDATRPLVTAAAFDHAAGPGVLRFSFSESVADSLGAADFVITNDAGGAPVPPDKLALTFDAASHAVSISFPGYPGGRLPDGAYRVTLQAVGVEDLAGNALAAGHVLRFFVLAGDINRDRTVNGSDFAILAGNFGKTGMTLAQGDVNGDGSVNGSDFAILAGNFGRALPEPAAAVVAPPPAPAPAKSQEVKQRSRPVAPRRLATPPPRAVRPTDASPLRRGLRAQRHGR